MLCVELFVIVLLFVFGGVVLCMCYGCWCVFDCCCCCCIVACVLVLVCGLCYFLSWCVWLLNVGVIGVVMVAVYIVV